MVNDGNINLGSNSSEIERVARSLLEWYKANFDLVLKYEARLLGDEQLAARDTFLQHVAKVPGKRQVLVAPVETEGQVALSELARLPFADHFIADSKRCAAVCALLVGALTELRVYDRFQIVVLGSGDSGFAFQWAGLEEGDVKITEFSTWAPGSVH